MHTLEVIRARGSTRAFLPKPVAPELILQIIAAANYAPSGSNIQPWHVHVVSGAARDALCARVVAAASSGPEPSMAYQYSPSQWREPYLSRRRACGWGLYGTLGIKKTDREAMQAQQLRNFMLFDAPVGLYFTIDRDLNQGSWLDYGTVLENIMIAAREFSCETPSGTVRWDDEMPDGMVYAYHFTWCCYAIVWAIQQYDAARKAREA